MGCPTPRRCVEPVSNGASGGIRRVPEALTRPDDLWDLRHQIVSWREDWLLLHMDMLLPLRRFRRLTVHYPQYFDRLDDSERQAGAVKYMAILCEDVLAQTYMYSLDTESEYLPWAEQLLQAVARGALEYLHF